MTERCPVCKGVRLPFGYDYTGDDIVCTCRITNGTIWHYLPVKPPPTQLDRIEQKLDELLARRRRRAKD